MTNFSQLWLRTLIALLLLLTPTFAEAASRYWVGSTGNWSDATNHWAASDGGSPGASLPTTADDCFFTNASGGGAIFTVTLDTTVNCHHFDVSGITLAADKMTLVGGSQTVNVSGSWNTPGSTFFTRSGDTTINFIGTVTGLTIASNGVAMNINTAFTINGVGGEYTMQSGTVPCATPLSFSCNITVTNGSFKTGGNNMTIGGMVSTGSGIRSIDLSTSVITLSSGTWSFSGSNLTLTAGSSTIAFARAWNGAGDSFAGGGLTYGTVSALGLNITDANNTFGNLTLTGSATALNPLILAGDQTVTGTLNLSNSTTATARVFVQSSVIGTPRTITANGTVSALADVDFRDITAAGSVAGPWSGTRLGDLGGNSNITTTAGTLKYWNLAGSQNWSATGWATSSGGSPAANNFPLAQDTAVFNESGAAGTVTINAAWNLPTIDMSARTTAFTFAFGSQSPVSYGDVTLFSGLTITGTGTWSFAKRGTLNFTSAGISLPMLVVFHSGTGSFKLLSNLATSSTSTAACTVTSGTLNLNGFNFTCGGRFIYNSTTGYTGSIVSGGGKIILPNNNDTILSGGLSGTFSFGDRVTFQLTYAGATGTRIVSTGPAAASEAQAPSVQITGNATDIVNLTSGASYFNVDMSGFSGTRSNTSNTVYGDYTQSSAMTNTAGANALTFSPTNASERLITPAGVAMDFPVTINGVGGKVGLAGALTVGSTRTFTITNGTFNDHSFAFSLGNFAWGVGTATLTKSGAWTVTGSGTAWSGNSNNANKTIADSGSISMTSASAKTFAGGGLSYGTLIQGGAGTLTVTQANSFADIQASIFDSTVTLPASTTTTVSAFTLGGSSGHPVTLNSSTSGTQATLSKSSGTVSVSNLSIKDSKAAGGAIWNAFIALNGNTNVSGNSGWNFAPFNGGGNFFIFMASRCPANDNEASDNLAMSVRCAGRG